MQDLVARIATHLVRLLSELQIVHMLHQVLGIVSSKVPVLTSGLVHDLDFAILDDAKLLIVVW